MVLQKETYFRSIIILFLFIGIQIDFITNKLIPAAINRWQSLLSLVRVNGNLYAYRECLSFYVNLPYRCSLFAATTSCGNSGSSILNIPNDYFGVDVRYYYDSKSVMQREVYPAGTGIPNTDFGLFVTAIDTTLCQNSPTTLAYAKSCQRDQFDRPTFGRINFCPSHIDTNIYNFEEQLSTALHEIAHALGFSSASWYLFRYNDILRTPRTVRDNLEVYVPNKIYSSTYCSDGLYLPNFNTIKYFQERGMTANLFDYTDHINAKATDLVHKMVTPRVLQAARDFFDCPTLNGAELENQIDDGCKFQGSHWEQRIFNNELMSSYGQSTNRISPITLALFEDSGWYVANYSNADSFQYGMDWGYKQGCEFVMEKCINPTTGISIGYPVHFANTSSTGACTLDREYTGYVTITKWSNTELPSQYRYLNTTNAGDLPESDYCPMVEPYSDGACKNPSNAGSYATAYYGVKYGPNSYCFESTLEYSSGSGPGAECFPAYCEWKNNQWVIQVTISNSNYTCTSAGQKITVASYVGSLTCADPIIFCGPRMKYDPNRMDGTVFEIPLLPSPTPTPSPSPTPGVKVQSLEMFLTNIPYTYLLNYGYLYGYPLTDAPFFTKLQNDICKITGTCGDSVNNIPILLYIEEVWDYLNGKWCVYIWDYGNDVAIPTFCSDSAFITANKSVGTRIRINFRVTNGAPSPEPGSSNPDGEIMNDVTLAKRMTLYRSRYINATNTDALIMQTFSESMNEYCSILLQHQIEGNCTEMFLSIIRGSYVYKYYSSVLGYTFRPASPSITPTISNTASHTPSKSGTGSHTPTISNSPTVTPTKFSPSVTPQSLLLLFRFNFIGLNASMFFNTRTLSTASTTTTNANNPLPENDFSLQRITYNSLSYYGAFFVELCVLTNTCVVNTNNNINIDFTSLNIYIRKVIDYSTGYIYEFGWNNTSLDIYLYQVYQDLSIIPYTSSTSNIRRQLGISSSTTTPSLDIIIALRSSYSSVNGETYNDTLSTINKQSFESTLNNLLSNPDTFANNFVATSQYYCSIAITNGNNCTLMILSTMQNSTKTAELSHPLIGVPPNTNNNNLSPSSGTTLDMMFIIIIAAGGGGGLLLIIISTCIIIRCRKSTPLTSKVPKTLMLDDSDKFISSAHGGIIVEDGGPIVLRSVANPVYNNRVRFNHLYKYMENNNTINTSKKALQKANTGGSWQAARKGDTNAQMLQGYRKK